MSKRFYGIFTFSEDTGDLLGYVSSARDNFMRSYVEYSTDLSHIIELKNNINKYVFGYQKVFILRITSGYLKPLYKKFGMLYLVDWNMLKRIRKDKTHSMYRWVNEDQIVPFYKTSAIVDTKIGVVVKLENTSDLGSDGVKSL